MKNLTIQFKDGQLIDLATGKEVLLLEGATYALIGDDAAFPLPVIKAYSVEEIRKKYPNAYAPWSAADDARLEELFCEGASLKVLAKVFGRNAGAIESRINKLELNEKYK